MARARPRDLPTPRNTWLLIRRGEKLVAQINGPVLELMTDSRTRLDQRIAGLGPDILAPELDEREFLRRLREDDPTRPIGDALIDQRIIAGIGNLWKAEGCFEAGIDPWRRTGDVSDEEALAIIHATRPRMQESARDGMQERFKVVYGIAGRPCPRCGSRLEHPLTRAGRRQPDDILVPTVSALRRIGHKGADLIVPGNTPASFDAALPARRRHDRVRRAAREPARAGRRPPAARARLRARRRRADARATASPTSRAARSTASSSTSTSSSPATSSG